MRFKHLSILMLFALLSIASKDKIKNYSKVLPGVTMVSENLYYDEVEASNFWWLEYLHWTKTNKPDLYQTILPDTNVWTTDLAYNEPYVAFYLRHVAYRDYPVVGVSWEQATEFCKWRTKRVEENLIAQGKRSKAPKHFFYRLPTHSEYLMMYDDIKSLPNKIGEEGKKKYRGMNRYNMKVEDLGGMGLAGKLNDNADVTAPTKSYWPNNFGVYNIKGNVAEWLLEPNTYTGGAWQTLMSEDVSELKTSDLPSAAIGFRCVCEISNEEFPHL
jgi:sulfatase modifying factor 1